MDEKMALVLCGIFARTNYGFSMPDIETVTRCKKIPPATPRGSAEFFCAQFMESNSHEDQFAGEAEMWFKEIKELGEEEARKIWPDLFKLYDDA